MVKTLTNDSELEDSEREDSALEDGESELDDALEEEELPAGLTTPQEAKTRLAKAKTIAFFFFINYLPQ
jgi:hypothetical protein